jgi:ribonuclease HII
MYLIGTDEAGYGPNLGPLVISATVWQISGESMMVDLYERLSEVVAARSGERSPTKMAIADSKVLYKPGGGLRQIERGVLAALSLLGHQARSTSELWKQLAPDAVAQRLALPWHASHDQPLPRDVAEDDLRALIPALRTGLEEAGVRLVTMRSTTLFPPRFNQQVERHGNKASALSMASLELVRDMLSPLDDAPIHVICDKHGGRNRYGPILQTIFPDNLVEVLCEGRSRSAYRWGPPERRIEIQFQAGGEQFLPAALASMASKYLREIAMEALNDYWTDKVDGLRPTAGYPVDAKRFKADIAPAQKDLAIDDHDIWRCR